MFIYVKLTIETGIFGNLFGVNTSIINELLHKNFYSSDTERKCKNLIFIKETAAILKGLGTKWYKCPNGHFYVVGECGRPMEQSVCPECRARIGGQHHVPEQGNVTVNNINEIFHPNL